MAIGVTKDHHNLRRNLELNSNYISNDGGDEGISITNDGVVLISDQLNVETLMEITQNEIDVSSGGLLLDVTGDLILDGGSGDDVIIDFGGHGTGLTRHVFEPNIYEMYSSDIMTIELNASNSTFTLHSLIEPDDYARFACAPNGAFSITTHDDVGALAHCTLNIDGNITLSATGDILLDSTGDIEINADGGTIDFEDDSVNLATLTAGSLAFDNAANATLVIDTTSSGTDGRDLTIEAGSAPADGADQSGGDLLLKAGGGDGTDTSMMAFYTKINGTDAVAERMRIHTDGSVGIGVADPDSLLEVFGESAQLKLSWDDSNYTAITVGDDGAFEIATVGSAASHLTLDSAGNVEFQPGRYFYVRKAAGDSTGALSYDMLEPELTIKTKDSSADYFSIDVGASAATTISTVDAGAAVGHLTIVADGHVEFDGCGVGFGKEIAAFSTSPIDSDANDSTDVDFRLGNKFELTLTDDISGISEFINLIFPATSGNFILVLIQGVADCIVANAGWMAYQSDGSTKATNNAGNNQADGRVRWAGGSAPTLSTTQYDVDIISFYWDADNQTAFAVASLDF